MYENWQQQKLKPVTFPRQPFTPSLPTRMDHHRVALPFRRLRVWFARRRKWEDVVEKRLCWMTQHKSRVRQYFGGRVESLNTFWTWLSFFFSTATTWQKMGEKGLVSRVCESKVLKWKVPEESVNRSLQTFALEFQMCDTLNCRCRKVFLSSTLASAQYPVFHLDRLDLHILGGPSLILAHIFVLNSSEVSELM